MTNISKIFLSSSDLFIEKKQDVKSLISKINFKKNVKAEVLNVISERSVTLSVLGSKVVAKSFVPLKAGDQVLLKAAFSDSKLILKFIGFVDGGLTLDKNSILKLLGNKSLYEDLAKIFTEFKNDSEFLDKACLKELGKLKDIFDLISLKSDKSEHKILENIIKTSGLSVENKIFKNILLNKDNVELLVKQLIENDVKTLMLKAAEKCVQGSETETKLKSFASGFEQLQILNSLSVDETGKFFLPLPVFDNTLLKFGQLFIDLGKAKDVSGEHDNCLIKVSFFLEMTNLGDLFGEFSFFEKAISGVFKVSNLESLNIIEENIDDLYNTLKKKGFLKCNIKCEMVAAKTLSDTFLCDKLLDKSSGLLSLFV